MPACDVCHATGDCPTCKGTGKTGGALRKVTCAACRGRKTCSACNGMGRK
jgi:hypothetical protein